MLLLIFGTLLTTRYMVMLDHFTFNASITNASWEQQIMSKSSMKESDLLGEVKVFMGEV